jgi:hypothetical protein
MQNFGLVIHTWICFQIIKYIMIVPLADSLWNREIANSPHAILIFELPACNPYNLGVSKCKIAHLDHA